MTATNPQRTFWVYKPANAKRPKGKQKLTRVQQEAEAVLVGSLTESGLHAPALDFDFKVTTKHLDGGITRLAFPTRGLDEFEWCAWDRLIFHLARLDLVHLDGVENGYVDPRYPTGRAPDAVLSKKALLASLERAMDCDEGNEPFIDLAVPVRLVLSSSKNHFHAYLDAEMPWDEYKLLLEELRDVGLLGKDWVKMAVAQKMTTLIRPGLTKKQLVARGLALPSMKRKKRKSNRRMAPPLGYGRRDYGS